MASARLKQQESAEQLANPNGAPDWATAIGAFGNGIVDTATFGYGDEIGAAADWAGSHILPWREAKGYDQALQEVRRHDAAVAEKHPVAQLAGEVTGALGVANGLVKAGLSPTAKAIENGAGLLKTSLASAAEGTAMGALQGSGSADGNVPDRVRSAVYGAAGGAATGFAIPGVTKALGILGRGVISPFVSSPERAAAANYLSKEGIQSTAGQATGSRGLRYAESELGGGKVADILENQGEQFTKATLKRAGINASRATPEVIDTGFKDVGQAFDGLAARNALHPDAQLANELGTTVKDYLSAVPGSQRAPIVLEMVRDLGNVLKDGPLDGSAYQAARSRLDRFARGAAADPQLQDALHGIRNALDDAMERSISKSNPSDLGAWKDARNRYRNLLVVEKAATGAGEDAALGLISPSKLRQATVTTHGRRNYARGKGDFAELSRAGEAILKPLPNSGTAPRLRAQNLGSGISALLGGGAGYLYGGDPSSMAAGTIAGIAAPRVAGAALMSPIVQAILKNQAAKDMVLSPTQRAIANALFNRQMAPHDASIGEAMLR